MSVATYTTSETEARQKAASLENTLRDYTLHYSATETKNLDTNLEFISAISDKPTNPPEWPTNYRSIPPYRPINRNLDLSERPNGSNRGELLFVTVMMNGVRLQAGLVRLWEATGARWYPGLTRYEIGGEW